MKIELTARKLYIVSAPAGVGKSTLLKSVNEFVVSADAFREQTLGSWTDAAGRLYRYEYQNVLAYEAMTKIISARAKEKLTTFVDATNRTEADRMRLAQLALQHGQEVEVLLLDLPLEEALRRNAQRAASIPEHKVRAHYEQFEKATALPHRVLDMSHEITLEVVPARVPDDVKLDVIGDVHGLYGDLLCLLAKLGYVIEPGSAPVHPDGRRLLFLGDVVDRGPQSLEVLELLYRAVKAGHYAIQGNHETKLVRFWKAQRTGGEFKLSLSAAETAMAFAQLPTKDQDRLATFLQFLPVTYVWKNFGFAHANLVYYDPIRTPASELLFGIGKPDDRLDTDADYCTNYEADINRYTLVRGHIEPTGSMQRRHVLSLEDRQAFHGNLMALDLHAYHKELAATGIWSALGYLDAFKAHTTKHACEFDFNEHAGPRVQRLKGLTDLAGQKLAVATTDPSGTLRLWKYSTQVFWGKLWAQDPLLLKARGLVLDLAGNVVAHPFDKVFNYTEEGAGLDVADDAAVIAIEKLNGFLGVVSPHPHEKNLLATTTGSFDSKFVGYIKDYLPGPIAGRVQQYFHHHGPLSLMFEVLHPEDPHIIAYGPEMHGLWLIGARRLDWDAPVLTEAELDELAATLGFRRPKVWHTTFGEVKAATKDTKTEGFMVRHALTHDYICKMKSPYYLTTKFLGRLSDKKANFLFKAPDRFKKDVDEEFYPIVDWLAATFELEHFKSLEDDTRVTLVREYIETQLA